MVVFELVIDWSFSDFPNFLESYKTLIGEHFPRDLTKFEHFSNEILVKQDSDPILKGLLLKLLENDEKFECTLKLRKWSP